MCVCVSENDYFIFNSKLYFKVLRLMFLLYKTYSTLPSYNIPFYTTHSIFFTSHILAFTIR